jgi:hypothetical protein
LESRLLAAIPTSLPIRRRRLGVLVGAVAAAAAAALLAWLVGPAFMHEGRIAGTGTADPPSPGSASTGPLIPPPDDRLSAGAWQEYRRVLHGGDLPPFSWPLEETSPMRETIAIASESLD